MKRTLPFFLLVACTLPVAGQTVLINENFDGYAVGVDITTLSPNFAVWPGGDGAPVSNAYAHSGGNSVEFIATGAGGGPGDVLLLLGDQTAGYYSLSWWMYIPAGFGGYWNIQHSEDVATPSFAAEVIFLADGSVSGDAGGLAVSGSYPSDTWFQVILLFDLDNTMAYFAIDATPIVSWPFNTTTTGTAAANQLGAIDFYSYGGGTDIGTFYIDDVAYIQMPVGIEETDAHDLLTFPNPASDQLFVDIPNLGTTPLVTLTDATGKIVAEGRAFDTVGEALRVELDLSSLPGGVYTLRVNDGAMAITRKVVKS